MKRMILVDGGTIPEEAQAEYEAQERLAQAEFDAVMAGAPSRTSLLAKPPPECKEFFDRAKAAYSAIEKPARAKRDEQRIPLGRGLPPISVDIASADDLPAVIRSVKP